MILNLGQASERLGFRTPVTLRKMLKRGVLAEYLRDGPDARSTYLEMEPEGLPTLEQQLKNHLQPHINSPLWNGHPGRTVSDAALNEAISPINDWIEGRADWSVRANEFLDPAAWAGPPWTRDQWVTLRLIIQLAEDC